MTKRKFMKSYPVMLMLISAAISGSLAFGTAWGAVVPPPDLLPLNQMPVPEPPAPKKRLNPSCCSSVRAVPSPPRKRSNGV